MGTARTYTLTTTDFDKDRQADGSWPTVELAVNFRKREWGGWLVVREDNGRELGWLTTGQFDDGKPCWEARVNSRAYMGEGPDDEGYILDDIAEGAYTLCRAEGGNTFKVHPVAYAATREEAATELFWHLFKNRAPGAQPNGYAFGAHPYVARWHDTHPVI